MTASPAGRSERVSVGRELVVEDLYASYDDHVVLHGVNIKVAAGSCVSVLGSNGAGKTTLMNAIAGIHHSWQGRISLGGRDLVRVKGHQVAEAGVCYIPEGRGVFPDLSVSDNLTISIGTDKAKWEKVFQYFPVLATFAHRRAGTLSGGEQQMLSIAPALVNTYGLLLVDELSLGLAPVIVDSLFSILAEIKTRGVSILLVEQFADRALALSERAFVIRKGAVVYDGSASKLRCNGELLHRLYLGEAS